MKVLFTFGGLPHYINPILNRLNAIDGLDIVVAIPDKGAKTLGDSVKEDKDGITFKLIYLQEKKAFYGNYYLKGLLKTIKMEKPDILVTIWPYILNIVADFKLKRHIKRNKIKLIIKEIPFDIPRYNDAIKYYKSDYALRLNEDMEIKTKLNFSFYLKHLILREIRRYYYSNLIDASVCYVDDAVKISSSYGLKEDSIFISSNSPDTDGINSTVKQIANQETIMPENPYRIIHVGRLVKWKRVDLLIKAVSMLKNKLPHIELIIIGKGKEEAALKEIVLELSLDKNVKFLGDIYGNAELGRFFAASSIYVLAGMGGLSINQAMAFGKPVICSIADGTEKKLVLDNFNGYYFENGNALDLAEKIELMLLDPDKIRDFGRNSLSIIKNEVNVYTVINGYLRAFNYVSGNSMPLVSNIIE